MIKSMKYILAVFIFAIGVAGPAVTLVAPAPSANAVPECDGRLMGIPPWYRGVTVNDGDAANPNCSIEPPAGSDQIGIFITKIALNVIEIGVVIAGYIAIGFILYGGFMFMTNGANPTVVEKARMTILNAVIGLAIALGAVAILNLIFGILG